VNERILKARGLFTAPMPQSVVDIITERLAPMLRINEDRISALLPLHVLIERVAINAYIQGFADRDNAHRSYDGTENR